MYEGLEQHVMKEIHKTLDERCMDTSCTNLSDFPAKFFTINPLRIIQARLYKQNFKSPAMLTDWKKQFSAPTEHKKAPISLPVMAMDTGHRDTTSKPLLLQQQTRSFSVGQWKRHINSQGLNHPARATLSNPEEASQPQPKGKIIWKSYCIHCLDFFLTKAFRKTSVPARI